MGSGKPGKYWILLPCMEKSWNLKKLWKIIEKLWNLILNGFLIATFPKKNSLLSNCTTLQTLMKTCIPGKLSSNSKLKTVSISSKKVIGHIARPVSELCTGIGGRGKEGKAESWGFKPNLKWSWKLYIRSWNFSFQFLWEPWSRY